MCGLSHGFATSGDLLGECWRGGDTTSQANPPLECFTKCKSLKDSDKLNFLLPVNINTNYDVRSVHKNTFKMKMQWKKLNYFKYNMSK